MYVKWIEEWLTSKRQSSDTGHKSIWTSIKSGVPTTNYVFLVFINFINENIKSNKIF